MALLIKRDATGQICAPPQSYPDVSVFTDISVHPGLQKVLREEVLRGASIVELSDGVWEINLGDGKPYFYSIETGHSVTRTDSNHAAS